MKRALLVRAGALGDVLLLRRAVFALRRAGFETALLAPRASGSVLVGPGESEVAALIDWNRTDVSSLFDERAAVPDALETELRGYDLALVCSRNEALREQVARLVPRLVGVDPAPPAGRHAARWYAGALASLGVDDAGDPPSLAPTDAERAQAREWRALLPPEFLALHPGSGAAAKNWPADRFAALARALSAGRAWLLVHGPADDAPAAALSREPGAVWAREPPPRVLAALLALARLYVGNDSGVTHLAAACGTPTLALFGPTDPAQWAPLGADVTALRAPEARMDRLEVDAVLAAAARATSAGRDASRQPTPGHPCG